jgi:hypothetical protein
LICWSMAERVGPLCTLVVEARDWGRFLLFVDVVVSDRGRDLAGIFPAGGWSGILVQLAGILGDRQWTQKPWSLESYGGGYSPIISMVRMFVSGWPLLLFLRRREKGSAGGRL